MLTFLVTLSLVAQDQQGRAVAVSPSTSREPSTSISYATKEQAAYRTCLSRLATALSGTVGVDSDDYLASVADLSCTSQREAFLAIMERELRQGPSPLLSEVDIIQMLQAARNEIVAWAEGMIFAKRLHFSE